MMEWTSEQIATLRAEWDTGASASVIGRRMGLTKNSVIGKARRVGCPMRGSPIKHDLNPDLARTKDYERRRRQRQHAATLEALPSLQGAIPATQPTPKPRSRPKKAKKAMPLPVKVAPSEGPVCECRWPIGEPSTKDFRFCKAPSRPGKSYCAEHCRVAYQPMRDFRDHPGWQPRVIGTAD